MSASDPEALDPMAKPVALKQAEGLKRPVRRIRDEMLALVESPVKDGKLKGYRYA